MICEAAGVFPFGYGKLWPSPSERVDLQDRQRPAQHAAVLVIDPDALAARR